MSCPWQAHYWRRGWKAKLDGFREYIDVRDGDILHLDSQNTFSKAHDAVAELLPALRSSQHIAVLSVNDEVALGAQAAFEEAGKADRVFIVSFGADQAAAKDLLRPASRLVGAVASFPERYGELILSVAIDLLHGKPVPQQSTQTISGSFPTTRLQFWDRRNSLTCSCRHLNSQKCRASSEANFRPSSIATADRQGSCTSLRGRLRLERS
ncbi:MAG: substrate-binding domain-containing protein [Chloroflexi bacterium]|nr:substrate-binding domain-containing protein [Chloroflexota bacterium]